MSNAVDSLLIRLKIPGLIPKFREKGLDRIVTLRKLSEDELRSIVPDDEQRQLILGAINNRGTHDKKQAQPAGAMNPPRNTEDGGRGSGGFPRGSSRGGGRMGGGGRGGHDRGGPAAHDRGGPIGGGAFPVRQRACNHFFAGDCKYGDTCRYSHDQAVYQREAAEGVVRRQHDSPGNTEDYSEVCEIPTHRIKFLLGNKAERLKQIHDLNKTHNKPFKYVESSVEKFDLVVYGSDPQSVLQSKKMILACVGVTRAKEQKNRLMYTINELGSNQHTAKLLAACNIKNEGTMREISEASLRNVISFLRFEKQQDVRHFWVNTTNDRHKLETIATIVAQLKGVQAIMFCDQKRVAEMSKVPLKIARFFNGVNPLFIHRDLPKEERMKQLHDFKVGEVNENGIRERLLVTNEDYAKLARKTIVPYVNLIINFSMPRTEEFYLLQSLVAGRNDTVGVSILCVSAYDQNTFREMQQDIPFTALEDENSFSETALQLVYDTVENPLTSEDADPPNDWANKMNQKKDDAS
ncbi:Helicase [Trypanosoma melophagium]|uniref:Helicase n=1 Tax=Trypanosoma melophagium TaxID=715481 RepID=UPI00351AAF86|nr:Helicase [Trypanosoma melophagium]